MARATCLAGCGAVVGHPWQKCHECATAAVVAQNERREQLRRQRIEAYLIERWGPTGRRAQ